MTIKDVLRHEAGLAHREATPAPAFPHPRNRNNSIASSNGWHDSWVPVDAGEEGTHGLEVALEEGFAWMRIKGSQLFNVVEGLMGKTRGRSRQETSHEAAYDFEMVEEHRDTG